MCFCWHKLRATRSKLLLIFKPWLSVRFGFAGWQAEKNGSPEQAPAQPCPPAGWDKLFQGHS